MRLTANEIIVNDRMGRKVRVKCFESDTTGDLKKLVATKGLLNIERPYNSRRL